jgi:hypothetical protein
MQMVRSTLALAFLGLFLQACGGSDGGSVTRFTGTWHPTSGTVTKTCPGLAPDTSSVTSNLIWSKGISSDLVSTNAATSCVLNADISGSTASGMGPPCASSDGLGGTLTLTITAYTFALAADGQTATENGSGTAVDNNGGQSLTCMVSETASYQKTGN